VVEVRVGQQHQVDRRQVLHPKAGSPQALEQKEPVGELAIDDGVEALELNQERGVPDPRQRQLVAAQLRKVGDLHRARGRGLEGMPDHLTGEGPGVEVVGRGEVPERTRHLAPTMPDGFGNRRMGRQGFVGGAAGPSDPSGSREFGGPTPGTQAGRGSDPRAPALMHEAVRRALGRCG